MSFGNQSKLSWTSSPSLLCRAFSVKDAGLLWNIPTPISGFTKPRCSGAYHSHIVPLATLNNPHRGNRLSLSAIEKSFPNEEGTQMSQYVVLSVGRDPLLMRTRTGVLLDAGYSVLPSFTSRDAFQIFSSREIDLVILCHTGGYRQHKSPRIIHPFETPKRHDKLK